MKDLLTFGQMLTVNARLLGEQTGARDLQRSMTFRQWNARSCRLANALLGLGLAKGERVAVLAYNCVEWAEIYAATAKAGLVVVPVNFRLIGQEIRYVVEHAEVAALIVEDALVGVIEEVQYDLAVPDGRFIHFGKNACPAGFHAYEELLAAAGDGEPDQPVALSDPWSMMYTSGTTGKPKGVIRSHKAAVLLSLITEIELALHREDGALLVMPMCHANSLNFFGAFAYCGAATTIYSRKSFDPEEAVRSLATGGATFTSLVPTHYIMMLGLPENVRRQHDCSRVTKLMISSAPARQDTKRDVMAMFPNSGLFELYGSTEAGWVTMLHPDEQFDQARHRRAAKPWAPRPIMLLERRRATRCRTGEAGELYSCNPYTLRRLLEQCRRRHGRGLPRRLPVPSATSRSGATRTATFTADRPQEKPDHLRRREHLPLRGGG